MVISIPLNKTKVNAEVRYESTVDDIDGDLALLSWSVSQPSTAKSQYAINAKGFLHRIVMGRVLGRKLERYEYVDHIDCNGLNNTRDNLRIASPMQNNANAKRQKNNTSGYKGVKASRNKWEARITFKKKTIFLGLFNTPEEAHKAYCEAAEKYFGVFMNAG